MNAQGTPGRLCKTNRPPAAARGDLLPGLREAHGENYLLNRGDVDAEGLSFAAALRDPVSGRRMAVYTTEPCLQLFSANHLDGASLVGKGAVAYPRFGGVCLECQRYPDAVNNPAFGSVRLDPGAVYRQVTELRFEATPPGAAG